MQRSLSNFEEIKKTERKGNLMTEQENVNLLYSERKERQRSFTADYLNGNLPKLETDTNYVISVLQYYKEGHCSKDFELGMLLGEAYAYKRLLYERDQKRRAELREKESEQHVTQGTKTTESQDERQTFI